MQPTHTQHTKENTYHNFQESSQHDPNVYILFYSFPFLLQSLPVPFLLWLSFPPSQIAYWRFCMQVFHGVFVCAGVFVVLLSDGFVCWYFCTGVLVVVLSCWCCALVICGFFVVFFAVLRWCFCVLLAKGSCTSPLDEGLTKMFNLQGILGQTRGRGRVLLGEFLQRFFEGFLRKISHMI